MITIHLINNSLLTSLTRIQIGIHYHNSSLRQVILTTSKSTALLNSRLNGVLKAMTVSNVDCDGFVEDALKELFFRPRTL